MVLAVYTKVLRECKYLDVNLHTFSFVRDAPAVSARMFVGGHVVGRDVLLFLPACLLVDGACLAVMCDILGQVGRETGLDVLMDCTRPRIQSGYH